MTQQRTTSVDRALDPHRLIMAAHEIGHAVAWAAAGIPVVDIWVKGRGPQAHGYVKLDGKELRSAAELRDYLVGLLAGRAASIRWCDQHGLDHDDGTCTDDLTQFRRHRTDPKVQDLSDRQFHAAARRVVRQHWPRIARLTPELARRGSIKV